MKKYNLGTLSKSETLDLICGVKTITTGAFQAVGSIEFAANPTEEDTITVAGVVFTFMDTAVADEDINIGIDLGTTIDNAVTVIGGYFTNIVTPLNVTDTTLQLTYYPGISSTYYPLSATLTVAGTVTQPVGGTGKITISIAHRTNEINITDDTTTVDQYVILPPGVDGQILTIYIAAYAPLSGDLIIIDPDYNTLYTINTANDYLNLVYLPNVGWKSIGSVVT